MFELYCRSLDIVPSVNLFCVFYKVSKQGHWFSFEKRVGKGAGGQIFRKTFSGLKGWKKRFFFLDRRAISDSMAWRHHDSDVNDPVPKDSFSVSDVQILTKRVIDLKSVPFGLLFQGGLATTWDFPGFCPVFKDTEGNVVTMFEYLRFPFSSGVFIVKRTALTNQDRIAQHTTPPLPKEQPVSNKTDHQKKVEVEDPKIVATKERKAQAAAKKKGSKKRGANEGEGSCHKVKRRKASATRGDNPTRSGHVSSPELLRVVDPIGPAIEKPSNTGTETAESRDDWSLHIPPHDSANHSIHDDTNVHEDEETNSLRLGSFVDESVRNLTLAQTEVFQSSPDAHVDEGESSRHQAYYVPEWFIHQRCLLYMPMWCRELMVHLVPPAAREESNALTNATALERAWFALGRGALSHEDIQERFENLQADYNSLSETHSECTDTVRKLVQARLDLAHSSHLYTNLADRYKVVKSEHENCTEKLEVLENRNRELSQVNKDLALRIKELEDELAKKDSALVYAERINAERAQEKEKLVAQLSKTEMEKFDCISKLLPTVVNHLFQSHEYKESLSKPFNLAIQAGWAKGLAKEHFEKGLLELMSRMENFDAYADKKMYVEYDKLFEKRYPLMEKISRSFCHTVSDLLKIYPGSPPPRQAPPSKPSSRKAPSSSAPNKP
ncbi:hypothetical protein Tco_0261114 [Tanacetum coccineum]